MAQTVSRTRSVIALVAVTLAAGIGGGVVGGGAAIALVKTAYNGPTQRRAVSELVVNSRQLQEPITLRIHLPHVYDDQPDARFPVLWVLDGPTQGPEVFRSARTLAQAGVIEPWIVVEVPSSSRGRRPDFTPPWEGARDDAQAHRFLAFLETEVLPAVAEAYRIEAGGVLVGHSLGGLFVLHAFAEEPSLFQGYFAFSPSVWVGDQAILEELEEGDDEPDSARGRLFLSLGESEGNEMASGFEAARQRLGSQPGLRWHAEITQGADHMTNPVLSFPAAMKWYNEELRTDGDA